MRKITILFLVLSILQFHTRSQTSFKFTATIGPTFTSPISYQNCKGYINPSATLLMAFSYYPHPSWGLELDYSDLNPTTYLYDPDNNSVQVYTRSKISIQRILAGLNYSFPFRKIRPYLGCLYGISIATTTQTPYTSSYTSFSWLFQTGIEYYFSGIVGLRLNSAVVTTSGIPNNTSYFNVDKYGSGFPSFAVGNPSSANILQWNISIGAVVRLAKKSSINAAKQ